MEVVVSAVIFKVNSILMVQEGSAGIYNKKWGLPTGHLEEGEGLLKCIVREVKEETGISAQVSRLIKIQNFKNEEGKQIIKFTFVLDFIEGVPTPDNNEITDVKWLDIDDLQKMDNNELRDALSLKSVLYFIKEKKFYPLEIIKDLI